MNKKKVWYVVVAMTLSLVGLVLLQTYWTSQNFILREKVFRNTVSQAVLDVVLEINHREVAEHFMSTSRNTLHLIKIDSINKILSYINEKYPNIDFESENSAIIQNNSYNFIFDYPSSSNVLALSYHETELSLNESAEELKIKELYKKLLRERNAILDNNRLIDNLIHETSRKYKDKYIFERIDIESLNAALLEEFEQRALPLDFEWGIFSLQESKLIAKKCLDESGVELMQTKFYYPLFPNDPGGSEFLILVNFPGSAFFIGSRMWYIVLTALALVFVQIFAYIYTLRYVFSQYRFSVQKADFINHITHEIKTPVSTISLVCESFLDADINYSTAEKQNLINIIKFESDRLQNLSRKIVDISNFEKGMYQLNKEECSLHAILDAAANNSGFQIMLNSGEIIKKYEASNDKIFADKERMLSVFSNLIENANKYCDKKPIIRIETKNIGNFIEVCICDNGIGIAKNKLKKIFEKLYRIDNKYVYKTQGYGLGLSFVKSICEQHRAKVWVESVVDKGSSFYIAIPVER